MLPARASRSKLVVVVDDDRLVLEAMAGLLRSWGFAVVTAASERAAVELLADEPSPPDLILCDYRLAPGSTGFAAIERLRGGSDIPAVIITADPTADLLREGDTRDIRVLAKPVTPARLRRLLRELL
jgi:CheY-like chemotaxis protein